MSTKDDIRECYKCGSKEEKCVCKDRGLEKGDTLYISSDWDGGIGFDYIHNIKFCPVCGKELPEWRK